MSPSKQVKKTGLKSVKQISEISEFKVRNLFNMARDNPVKFEIILLGCKAKLNQSDD
jgi:hypothetical protein